MTLIQRIARFVNLLERQHALIQAQQTLIANHQHETRRLHLTYTREIEGIVSGWLLHLEQPELDLRDDLVQLIATLSYRVAELEEHVV